MKRLFELKDLVLYFRNIFFGFSLFAFGLFVFSSVFLFFWKGKIFPGISVSSVSVANLPIKNAQLLLEQQSEKFMDSPVTLTHEDQEWQIVPEELKLKYEILSSVNKAYSYGRRGFFFAVPEFVNTFISSVSLPLSYTLDEELLSASVSAVASTINIPSVPPSITVLEKSDVVSGSRILVEEGEVGRRLNTSITRLRIHQALAEFDTSSISLPVEIVYSNIRVVDVELTKMRAERLLNKQVKISYKQDSESLEWELTGEDLVGFLDFDIGFDQEKVASYSATLASSINRDPVNATFVYKDGRVEEFVPAQAGLRLSVEGASNALVEAFLNLETSEEQEAVVELPVTSISPAITIEDVNTLGIKELLGRGKSTFHGSIANREYNIALASSQISGVLVPPGETFSFNKSVGDVSRATGYRQSYIIKEGRTILDDGGGVCQVSTTLFRSVLDAGLPIVERRAHSYRVYYYEQNSKPGYDATVFFPTADLKFKNDTPAHILIQTTADTKANSLTIELYGTSDGRVATLSNHRMWDVSPPPPDLYQDDPTLPVGTVKQVDWKAWGAKAKFDYLVTRDGETIFEKTFYSNFKPWQSVFLRGTGQ